MSETNRSTEDVDTIHKPAWLRRIAGRREYWIGGVGIVITVILCVGIVIYWDEVGALKNYSYLGAFIISILGGSTIIVPVPMTPVVFTLGAVTKPEFAPYLGPVFIGAAAGLGETLGALTIYLVGYGGGTPLAYSRKGKLQAAYLRMVGWVERRGSVVLFILSAVLNPFFFPAALAAGALRFDIIRYFFICWAGKTIKGITVASAGYWGLGSILRMLGVSI